MHSKVSSDQLSSYIKATWPVLKIFKMAGYFLDRPLSLSGFQHLLKVSAAFVPSFRSNLHMQFVQQRFTFYKYTFSQRSWRLNNEVGYIKTHFTYIQPYSVGLSVPEIQKLLLVVRILSGWHLNVRLQNVISSHTLLACLPYFHVSYISVVSNLFFTCVPLWQPISTNFKLHISKMFVNNIGAVISYLCVDVCPSSAIVQFFSRTPGWESLIYMMPPVY